MAYEPREGVDYIFDYYAIAGVESDAEIADVKKALNHRVAEYHPDRLEGLAPEIRARGERMSRILNKARGILVDPEKRSAYDEIRAEWTGPLSDDGTPVITQSRDIQMNAAMKSAGEIEAMYAADDEQVDVYASYSSSRIEFLEKMIETMGEGAPTELREQYEDALLEYDRNLAIKEAQRGDLLGMTDIGESRYRASLEYGDKVTGELEVAKVTHVEKLRALALGKTARKLELLSGEGNETSSELVDVSTIQAPEYFDVVAKQVSQIAEMRQGVVERRLANYQPEYPEAELQSDVKTFAAFGLKNGEKLTWLTFSPDLKKGTFDSIDAPEDVAALLSAKDYAAVIGKDFNVVILPMLEQLEMVDLLNEGVNKYVSKYYPDDNDETPVK